ncbi:response regulator [Roseobacter sp.]|uniref:response regulator n=1 Tax=Roseobacter sp. TaxID=1907202 RepID=UPI00385F5899
MGKIFAKLRPEAAELPKSAKILIVDNQRFERAHLIRLIDSLEFETHVVQSDCLATMKSRLNAHKFDLIFMDCNLPDGTGLQALEAIQFDPNNKKAATIIIAGDGQNGIAIEALKRGCSDYIAKDDLTPSSFRRASMNALQKSRLSIKLETQQCKTQNLEALLEGLAKESHNEVKPVVSRIVRQLRELREEPELTTETLLDRCNRIERSCGRLKLFLDDIERCQNIDFDHKTVAGRTTQETAGTGTVDENQPENSAPSISAKPRRIRAPQAKKSPLKSGDKAAKPSLFSKLKK